MCVRLSVSAHGVNVSCENAALVLGSCSVCGMQGEWEQGIGAAECLAGRERGRERASQGADPSPMLGNSNSMAL